MWVGCSFFQAVYTPHTRLFIMFDPGLCGPSAHEQKEDADWDDIASCAALTAALLFRLSVTQGETGSFHGLIWETRSEVSQDRRLWKWRQTHTTVLFNHLSLWDFLKLYRHRVDECMCPYFCSTSSAFIFKTEGFLDPVWIFLHM